MLGGFLSIMILILTLSFGTKGMIDIYQRNNPTINVYNEKSFFIENKLSLSTESNFRFAFAAGQNFKTTLANSKVSYDDSRYVKYAAYYRY